MMKGAGCSKEHEKKPRTTLRVGDMSHIWCDGENIVNIKCRKKHEVTRK